MTTNTVATASCWYNARERERVRDLARAVAVRHGPVDSRVVGLHRLEDRLECRASAHCRFKRISFERFRVVIKYLDDDYYYRTERNRSTGLSQSGLIRSSANRAARLHRISVWDRVRCGTSDRRKSATTPDAKNGERSPSLSVGNAARLLRNASASERNKMAV